MKKTILGLLILSNLTIANTTENKTEIEIAKLSTTIAKLAIPSTFLLGYVTYEVGKKIYTTYEKQINKKEKSLK